MTSTLSGKVWSKLDRVTLTSVMPLGSPVTTMFDG